MEAALAGKKRKREESSGVVAGAAVAAPAPVAQAATTATTAAAVKGGVATARPSKSWRHEGSGAREVTPGVYRHEWDENARDGARDKFRYGKWEAAEDAVLLKAYDDYCVAHGLVGDDRLRVVMEVSGGGSHGDVWAAVASHFKHRTIRSVQRRLVRLLHPYNNARRGPWTNDDRVALVDAVMVHGRSWKRLSSVLKRTPNDCVKEYTAICEYVHKLYGPDTELREGVRRMAAEGRVAESWSREEEEALVRAVQRLGTRTAGTGYAAYTNIPWALVAASLPRRTEVQCRTKWSSYGFALRASGSVWDATMDAELVRAVWNDGGEYVGDVAWGSLMPGLSAVDCHSRFERLSKRIPRSSHIPFEDLLRQLVVMLCREEEAAAGDEGGSDDGDDDDGSGGKEMAVRSTAPTSAAGGAGMRREHAQSAPDAGVMPLSRVHGAGGKGEGEEEGRQREERGKGKASKKERKEKKDKEAGRRQGHGDSEDDDAGFHRRKKRASKHG